MAETISVISVFLDKNVIDPTTRCHDFIFSNGYAGYVFLVDGAPLFRVFIPGQGAPQIVISQGKVEEIEGGFTQQEWGEYFRALLVHGGLPSDLNPDEEVVKKLETGSLPFENWQDRVRYWLKHRR